jgi:CDP-diacylglycerol---glycerol-3-phosphate 3-phosphatidyltransferase
MFNLPNCLSLARIPLAFVFFSADPIYRAAAILIALITDGLDGFFARRYNQVTRLGTLLDPFTDKFFVFFVLATFIHEQRLSWMEAALFICRDFSVVLYGCYLAIRGRLLNYKFRAIWCGKTTTVLQLVALLGMTYQVQFPPYFFGLFAALGISALIELYFTDKSRRRALGKSP